MPSIDDAPDFNYQDYDIEISETGEKKAILKPKNPPTIRSGVSVPYLLGVREKELLELKGPCSNSSCPLHYAHAGPCS